jgi:hypothetical protein
MVSPESEPKPVESPPIKRFYSDIRIKGELYADLLILTEEYLKRDGAMIEGTLRPEAVNKALPTAKMFELNARTAREQFELIPLRFVAPIVELTRPSNEVADWYKVLADNIMLQTNSLHTNCQCARIRNSLHCENSGECPRNVLRGTLINSIRVPDFSDIDYLVDPDHVFRVTIDKARLATRLGLAEIAYIDTCIGQYKSRFRYAFPEVEEILPQQEE